MKNYYDELEVSKTASKEVLERVYKVLAKKYHPDTTQELDKQTAEEKFKRISEAYEVLSDDIKRRKYDQELNQSTSNISYEDLQSFVQIPEGHNLNSIDCYYYIQAGLIKRLTIQEVRNIEGDRQNGYALGEMHNRYTREGEIVRQTLINVFN